MRNPGRWRGFTLIELLVVVTIIVLLVAILLPTLARARVQAKKTICASNMRSTALAAKEYAAEYGDVTPLGAWANKQFNYIVYFGQSGVGNPPGNTMARPSAYGLVHSNGYILSGKICFCPVTENQQVTYNTAANPWRDYPLLPTDPYGGFRTSMGFGMRPLANWVPYQTFGKTPADKYPLLNTCAPLSTWTSTIFDDPDVKNIIIKWPKLSDMENIAILSDITPHYPGLLARHKDGVNVVYGSGAQAWVPVAKFINDIVGPGCPSASVTDPSTGFSATYNNNMLNDSVTPNTGYWADLDNYH